MNTEQIIFGPYRFDPIALQLWRDEQVVAVQPKPLAVLRALATRPGQVVTKRELLKEVWAGTYVTQAVLKVAVRALREALGERADTSHYVETVGRDGYRFIAPPPVTPLGLGFRDQGTGLPSSPIPEPRSPNPVIVGREADLTHLHNLLEKALRGEPQFVFITGEPGIGKTTLIEAFLFGVRSHEKFGVQNSEPRTQNPELPSTLCPWFAYGQCIEHYGPGEPYLPVLEAMSRLCREAGGQQVLTVLRRHAPTWLVQLPGVIEEGELQTLRLQVQGATQPRMLREIAEAIEVGTIRRPLVLILEDLHWSDSATIEFLASLAKRRQPMRLLVVATYRPIEVVMGAHPVKTMKQDLQTHGLCEELRLELLKKQEIEAYVAGRFPESDVASVLAPEVYRCSEGNPLFMVNVVEHFLTQGLVIHENGRWVLRGEVTGLLVPENVRQLIGQQVERLREEQKQVLEGASIAGAEFVVAAVAAAVKQEMDEVETVCEEIAGQGHFLEERGIAEWPDGTISGRYAFRHALYQNVLSERIAEARRIRLHRLIGERLEQGYRDRAQEIAAELAIHFERGHEYGRAVQYCEQAGKNAIRRSAHREAIAHLAKGLELLKTLPDTPERTQQELALQVALGGPLVAIKGYAAPEVGKVYSRARELCQQASETTLLFRVLRGLWTFHFTRAEYQIACELGQQLLNLAKSRQDSTLFLPAHQTLGVSLLRLGELLSAREHLEQGIALYSPQQRHFPAIQDPGVICRLYTAWILWLHGYPDQALARSREALALAHDLSHPFSLAFALIAAAWVYQFRGEQRMTQELAEAAITLATEQGFALWIAVGSVLWGWTLAEQGLGEEGLAQIRQGIIDYQATGGQQELPQFLILLAKAHEKTGQTGKGLNALAEAFDVVNKTGERFYEAELYRLRGELMLAQSRVQSLESGVKKSSKLKLQSAKSKNTDPRPLTPDPQGDAEACFLKAINIAQRQQAKSLELRAVMSLVRLRQQQAAHHASRTTQHEARNKLGEAHSMLSTIYGWFTEGFDTKDLQEAKALLEELQG